MPLAARAGSRFTKARPLARRGHAIDPIGAWFVDGHSGSDGNSGRRHSDPLATIVRASQLASLADTVYYRATPNDEYRPVVSPSLHVQSVNMALWLSPSTIAVDSDDITTWSDHSGLNNFAAARDAPSITTDWLDGNAGLTFDGASKQVLRCGCFTGVGKGSKPVALIVASIDADHSTGYPTLLYLAGKNSLTSAAYQVLNISVGTVTGIRVRSSLGSSGTLSTSSGSGSHADGTPRLFMAIASGSTDRAESWSGNVKRATASTGDSGGIHATATHAVIGSGDENGGSGLGGHSRWLDGTIGEVLVFDGVPTGDEFAALFAGHYARRWPTIYAGLSL